MVWLKRFVAIHHPRYYVSSQAVGDASYAFGDALDARSIDPQGGLTAFSSRDSAIISLFVFDVRCCIKSSYEHCTDNVGRVHVTHVDPGKTPKLEENPKKRTW